MSSSINLDHFLKVIFIATTMNISCSFNSVSSFASSSYSSLVITVVVCSGSLSSLISSSSICSSIHSISSNHSSSTCVYRFSSRI